MSRPKPTVHVVRQDVMNAMVDLLRGVPPRPQEPELVHGFLEEVVVCLLDAVKDVGYEIVPLRGRATWMWEPFLGLHVPHCNFIEEDGSRCLAGPLPLPLVEAGVCRNHLDLDALGMAD